MTSSDGGEGQEQTKGGERTVTEGDGGEDWKCLTAQKRGEFFLFLQNKSVILSRFTEFKINSLRKDTMSINWHGRHLIYTHILFAFDGVWDKTLPCDVEIFRRDTMHLWSLLGTAACGDMWELRVSLRGPLWTSAHVQMRLNELTDV